MRKKYGEEITKDSPVLLNRFNRKSFENGTVKAINDGTIQGLLYAVRYKADLNIPSKHYNNRFGIKSAHGFRKFWNSTVKSIRTKTGKPAIPFVNKERMLGHTLVDAHALEENYDRSDRVKELLGDYLLIFTYDSSPSMVKTNSKRSPSFHSVFCTILFGMLTNRLVGWSCRFWTMDLGCLTNFIFDICITKLLIGVHNGLICCLQCYVCQRLTCADCGTRSRYVESTAKVDELNQWRSVNGWHFEL